MDGGAMFGVVPKTLWAKSHPPDEANRIELVTRSLLIEGEGITILIDTGTGQKWTEKERSRYVMDPACDLFDSLDALDISPGDITHVILTHLHFDHAGGNTTGGNGEFHPAFPNAEYLVQDKHVEWAQRPSERDRASFIPDNWECIEKPGQLKRIHGEEELFPGIAVRVVHGHTPFQQLPFITAGGAAILFCSDLIPLSIQVRLPWIMSYDLNPLETLREKKETLAMAVEEGWFLFLQHDPHCEMCQVVETDRGYAASDPVRLGDLAI